MLKCRDGDDWRATISAVAGEQIKFKLVHVLDPDAAVPAVVWENGGDRTVTVRFGRCS